MDRLNKLKPGLNFSGMMRFCETHLNISHADCMEVVHNISFILNAPDVKAASSQKHRNQCTTDTCWAFYGLILPIVCSLSLVASLVTLRVLYRMHRSSINICFMTLFCSEIVKMMSTLLLFTPFAYCKEPTLLCSLLSQAVLGVYPIALWSHMSSTCVCLIITTDRYLVISQPFRACYFTKRRTIKMLSAAAAVSVIYVIPTAFELEFSEECQCVKRGELRLSKRYLLVYYLIIRSIFGFGLMFIAIFVLNCLLLKNLLESQKNVFAPSEVRHPHKARSIVTLGCVGVVFGYLCTNTLPNVSDIIEALDAANIYSIKLIVYLGNTLVAVGPLLNAAIYCGVGAKFRTAMRGRSQGGSGGFAPLTSIMQRRSTVSFRWTRKPTHVDSAQV